MYVYGYMYVYGAFYKIAHELRFAFYTLVSD